MGKYFGTDGFRGEANIDLTADHAFKIGRFLGYHYQQNNPEAKIVIGKDTRRSSYMFEYALAAGITASIYLGTKKFGKQIDYAVKGDYTHTITVGGDEFQKSTLRLKNLSTREEIECTLDEAIEALKA